MSNIDVNDPYSTGPLPSNDVKPCASHRHIIKPGPGGLEIPVDKTKFRVRFIAETESRVDVIVEPKE